MSSPEIPDIVEAQAEVCFELGSKLRQRLIEEEDSKKVILDFVPRPYTSDFHWQLFFPFNITEDTVSGIKTVWLAELGSPLDKKEFEHSYLEISRAPYGRDGHIDIENRTDVYTLVLDSENQALLCDELGMKRFTEHLHNRTEFPRRNDGDINSRALAAPTSEEATMARILLEDALKQLG